MCKEAVDHSVEGMWCKRQLDNISQHDGAISAQLLTCFRGLGVFVVMSWQEELGEHRELLLASAEFFPDGVED